MKKFSLKLFRFLIKSNMARNIHTYVLTPPQATRTPAYNEHHYTHHIQQRIQINHNTHKSIKLNNSSEPRTAQNRRKLSTGRTPFNTHETHAPHTLTSSGQRPAERIHKRVCLDIVKNSSFSRKIRGIARSTTLRQHDGSTSQHDIIPSCPPRTIFFELPPRRNLPSRNWWVFSVPFFGEFLSTARSCSPLVPTDTKTN